MNLFEQFRDNRRLRIGAALVAWILALNALIDWNTHLAALHAAYRSSLSQLARLTPGQPLEVWNRRANDGRQALVEARGLLWRNTSAGLAQAQVQDWLGDALRRLAAQGVVVRVAEPETTAARPAVASPVVNAGAASVVRFSAPAATEARRPLRARIEFNTDPAVMLALLAALNNAEHRIGVDTLRVRPGKTEMSLTFWFELAPAAAGAAAGPAR